MRYQARQCEDPSCLLRFPVEEASELGASCPICGAKTRFMDAPYATETVQARGESGPATHEVPVEALLDNIRSLSNVGSIFRSADGAGVRHLHLGGFTPTPEHPKLARTALGAESSVAWTRHRDALAGARSLRDRGARLWALEAGERAEPLFGDRTDALVPNRTDQAPVVLVLGHEVSGVDPRILALCERVFYIPMAGVKGSLNVGVAFGIAAYMLRHGELLPQTAR